MSASTYGVVHNVKPCLCLGVCCRPYACVRPQCGVSNVRRVPSGTHPTLRPQSQPPPPSCCVVGQTMLLSFPEICTLLYKTDGTPTILPLSFPLSEYTSSGLVVSTIAGHLTLLYLHARYLHVSSHAVMCTIPAPSGYSAPFPLQDQWYLPTRSNILNAGERTWLLASFGGLVLSNESKGDRMNRPAKPEMEPGQTTDVRTL